MAVTWIMGVPVAAHGDLEPDLVASIEAITRPACGEGFDPVRTRCAVLATRLESVPEADRAMGLEKLMARCTDALPLTDPALIAITERALAARQLFRASTPAAYVRDLLALGLLRHHQGGNDETRALYEAAREAAKNDLGEQSEEMAFTLERLSTILVDFREYDAAMAAADQSRSIREKKFPVDVARVADSINAQATVRYRLDDLKGASALFSEALELSRKLPPGREPKLQQARFANNLGEVSYRLGESQVALSNLEAARALRQRPATEPPVPQLASTVLLLGDVYTSVGEYARAIESYEQAVALHRCWTGSDPYRLAEALTRLAAVYEESGAWKEAQRPLEEAIAIRRVAVASNGQEPAGDAARHRLRLLLARSLVRQGALQHRMGDPAAKSTLADALDIQEHELAGLPPQTDMAETLLASARREMDDNELQVARDHVNRAIAILEAVASNHPLLVEAYELSTLLGDDRGAEMATVDRGLELAEKIYGRESPKAADLWAAKAQLLRRKGDLEGAALAAVTAQTLSRDHVVVVVQTFPADQALVFAAERRRSLGVALAVLGRGERSVKAGTVTRIWEAMAASRALVFDAQAERERLAQASQDPGVGAAARRLVEARSRLAFLLVRSFRERDQGPSEVVHAAEEVRGAEAALAHEAAYRFSPPSRPASLPEVAAGLPPGSVLVSFIRFGDPEGGGDRYLAFVLARGASSPAALDLGPAVEIDARVARWRAEIALGEAGDLTAIRQSGEELRQRIWDPLVPHLGSAADVLVVPDGSLNLVSFPALSLADGRFLIEDRFRFHLLATERDVLELSPRQEHGAGLLLVGGVDYGTAARRDGATVHAVSSSTRTVGCRWALPFFSSLPATMDEVHALDLLWRTATKPQRLALPIVLSGADAVEDRVKRLAAGKRILHFATHGFIGLGECSDPRPAVRGVGELSLASASPVANGGVAGLALSGANRTDGPGDDNEDGILLADEVVDLDLRGVEWVVLSACKTGLGTVQAGEGVLGLRRAFQIAGARTLITSLWAIDDKAAQEWMLRLYSLRLSPKPESTLRAVNQATLGSLCDRRQRGLSTNPFFWAAFAAAGDWR